MPPGRARAGPEMGRPARRSWPGPGRAGCGVRAAANLAGMRRQAPQPPCRSSHPISAPKPPRASERGAVLTRAMRAGPVGHRRWAPRRNSGRGTVPRARRRTRATVRSTAVAWGFRAERCGRNWARARNPARICDTPVRCSVRISGPDLLSKSQRFGMDGQDGVLPGVSGLTFGPEYW
jgi:hypothetical protein